MEIEYPDTSKVSMDNTIASAFVSAWAQSVDVDVYADAVKNKKYHPFVCQMYDLWISSALGN